MDRRRQFNKLNLDEILQFYFVQLSYLIESKNHDFANLFIVFVFDNSNSYGKPFALIISKGRLPCTTAPCLTKTYARYLPIISMENLLFSICVLWKPLYEQPCHFNH